MRTDLAELYRRQRFLRRLWRYGTIGVGLAVASAVGDGDPAEGMNALFPVVFGSLFLNWSLFARRRLLRLFGVLALAGVGGITTAVLSSSAGLHPILVWMFSTLVGVVLLGTRVLLDRKVDEPIHWYTLTEPADPW